MATEESTVEYRDVQGYPGYRAGNDGTIWTCWIKVGRPNGESGNYSAMGSVYRRLKSHPTKKGHLQVSLQVNSSRKVLRVHRIILETFIGPCPSGMIARHFPDRNPANNNVSNLSWGTYRENEADKIIHGTDTRYGERNWRAKLSDRQVDEIRHRRSMGDGLKEMAAFYGVTRATISRIALGKRRRRPSVRPLPTASGC